MKTKLSMILAEEGLVKTASVELSYSRTEVRPSGRGYYKDEGKYYAMLSAEFPLAMTGREAYQAHRDITAAAQVVLSKVQATPGLKIQNGGVSGMRSPVLKVHCLWRTDKPSKIISEQDPGYLHSRRMRRVGR